MKSNSILENHDALIIAKWENEAVRLVQLIQDSKQSKNIFLKQSKLVDTLRTEANRKLCEITWA